MLKKKLVTVFVALVSVVALWAAPASATRVDTESTRIIHIGCDLRTSNGTNSVMPSWMQWSSSGTGHIIGSFRLSDQCGSLNITLHGFRFHPTHASDIRFNYVNSNNEWVIGAWSNNHAAGQAIRLLATGSPGHPVNQRFSINVRDHDAASRQPTAWPWVDLSF